jgi:hypothetical protein
MDIENLRREYLSHFQRPTDETEKAWESVRTLVDAEPRAAFDFFLSVLPELSDSQLLATVAIDIVEPLLRYHADEVADEILKQARQLERLRHALGSVYVGSNSALEQRMRDELSV